MQKNTHIHAGVFCLSMNCPVSKPYFGGFDKAFDSGNMYPSIARGGFFNYKTMSAIDYVLLNATPTILSNFSNKILFYKQKHEAVISNGGVVSLIKINQIY